MRNYLILGKQLKNKLVHYIHYIGKDIAHPVACFSLSLCQIYASVKHLCWEQFLRLLARSVQKCDDNFG